MLATHLFSLRLICRLLLPASFREDYGREIELLFREEFSNRRGDFARGPRIWIALLPDLVETAFRAHLEMLVADIRVWLRFVNQKRVFSAGLIGNFAASIALASAMFSVTYALLIRSLPYQDPDRLVNLDNFPTVVAQSKPGVVRDWLKTQSVFEDLADYSPWDGNLEGGSEPVRVHAAEVSPSFFSVFGQSVLLGSSFGDTAGMYAVLSEAVWQTQFGGDPAIVGKTVRVNGEELRVNGVMRPGFQFPDNTNIWTHAGEQAFLKLAEEQQAIPTFVVARLKKDASYQQGAAAAMALSVALVGEVANNYPKAAVPLQRALTASIRKPVTFLSIAAGLLLLLGCASATGLLAARNAQQQKEVAVRFALGANASRLRRQSIVEGTLYALSGGAIGTWGAYLLVRLIPSIVLPAGMAAVPLDKNVLGVGLITALLSGILTGWAAGWNATLRYQALPHGSWVNPSPSTGRFRRLLLAGQIALSVALLVWAGLQFKSLYKLTHADLGFDPNRLAAATISLKGSPFQSPQARRELVNRWQQRIEAAIPGSSAAAVSVMPMRLDPRAIIQFDFEGDTAKVPVKAAFRTVSANYSRIAGASIIAGRDFGPLDTSTSEPVALVNEQFGKALGLSPSQLIGRRVSRGNTKDSAVRIAGVYRRESTEGPELSFSLAQRPPGFLSVVVRVDDDPANALDRIRSSIRSESPQVTVFDVRPVRDYLADRLADQRLYALILGLFAALSAITSLGGLLSVALFYVSSRKRELGIRMALGATRSGLVAHVLRHGLPLLLAGAIAGEALAIAGGKGIAALLVNVEPLDRTMHVAIPATLLLCGLLTILAASSRVSRIDPSSTLRSE